MILPYQSFSVGDTLTLGITVTSVRGPSQKPSDRHRVGCGPVGDGHARGDLRDKGDVRPTEGFRCAHEPQGAFDWVLSRGGQHISHQLGSSGDGLGLPLHTASRVRIIRSHSNFCHALGLCLWCQNTDCLPGQEAGGQVTDSLV